MFASTKSETETAVICCPTLFNYTCLATISLPGGQPPQHLLGCTTTWEGAKAILSGVTVLSDGVTGGTTVATETAGGITAYGIQVRFRSGDPTPEPRTERSGIPTATPAPSPSQPLVPAEATPVPSGSGGSGISTPAAIGIGVGSAGAALLAAGLLSLFCILRRRRRNRGHSPPGSPEPPPVPPKEPACSPVKYGMATYGGVVPPPYELAEDATVAPASPRMSLASKRHIASAASALSPPGAGRADIEVLGYNKPAELEADVPLSPPPPPPPRDSSLRDRASPPLARDYTPSPSLGGRVSPLIRNHSASPTSVDSGWTVQQARGDKSPSVWM
ncbi:hypothetical protein VTK26DRAFT_1785 [Humicola hyalothermophila]